MQASLPHGPISSLSGRAIVLAGNDIDTDRIIPARFLKCVTFEGLGEQVFADDRAEVAAQRISDAKPSHPFDAVERQGANLLFVNRNFGCGSSREHAPQALMRWGIRALVGESFAEIFFGNCLALGIPCLTAAQDVVLALQETAVANASLSFKLNLANCSINAGDQNWSLQISPGPLQMLLSGQWDGTQQLLANREAIDRTKASLPYLQNFKAQ
jgi:3-isopropylmalate/(R)-2-methylmalate dehydratase small subunit